jgi:hypothetical protein
MCKYLDVKSVDPGWGCCHCEKKYGSGIYNGMWRKACKRCQKLRCSPLTPDRETGRVFENRLHNRDRSAH